MEKRLPYEISEYINDHYREDFLFLLKDVKEVAGEKRYNIEVTKDNYIHTLHFNEEVS